MSSLAWLEMMSVRRPDKPMLTALGRYHDPSHRRDLLQVFRQKLSASRNSLLRCRQPADSSRRYRIREPVVFPLGEATAEWNVRPLNRDGLHRASSLFLLRVMQRADVCGFAR